MHFNIEMALNGRIVIPQKVRELLGLQSGGTIILHVDEDDNVQMTTRRHGLMQAQRMTLAAVKDTEWEHRSAVDALIEDRRLAAEREDEDLFGTPRSAA